MSFTFELGKEQEQVSHSWSGLCPNKCHNATSHVGCDASHLPWLLPFTSYLVQLLKQQTASKLAPNGCSFVFKQYWGGWGCPPHTFGGGDCVSLIPPLLSAVSHSSISSFPPSPPMNFQSPPFRTTKQVPPYTALSVINWFCILHKPREFPF